MTADQTTTPEARGSTESIGSFTALSGREPWNYFEELRAIGDVVWDPELRSWIVCSHRAYKELGRTDDLVWRKPNPTIDEEMLSEEALFELRGGRYGLVFLHGSEHARAHRWRTQWFSPRAVRAWRSSVIQPVVNRLVDHFIQSGSAELVEALTDRMPIRVLAAIEGLPWMDDEWIDRFRALQMRANDYRGGFGRTVDPVVSATVLGAIHDMYEMILPFVRARRDHARSDLISSLWSEGPRLFSDWTESDVVSHARGLFDAGTDTTGKALANSLYLFMKHPQLLEQIRVGDRGLERFADEALRLYSPRVTSYRVAMADVDLCGVRIKKGESVTALIAAANRDPAAFSCPHAVDLDRPRPRDHLTFHVGPRFCAGAPLVRAEIEELVRVVMRRLSDLRLDTALPSPEYTGVVSRQFRPLHVRFAPGKPASPAFSISSA